MPKNIEEIFDDKAKTRPPVVQDGPSAPKSNEEVFDSQRDDPEHLHRVEGGACVPHGEAQLRLWGHGATPEDGQEAMLAHSRTCARALIAALRDLKMTQPSEIQGVL